MRKYDAKTVVEALKRIFMNNTYSLKTLFNIEKHTVIVTGANGQVGSEIVDALIDLGSKVIAIDIKFKNLENINQTKTFSNLSVTLLEKKYQKVYEQLNNMNVRPTASDK